MQIPNASLRFIMGEVASHHVRSGNDRRLHGCASNVLSQLKGSLRTCPAALTSVL